MAKIKVLIVDDSALVRQIFSAGLSKDPDIEVVGTANDPFIARDKILSLQPDVVTLDVNMPQMNGVDFLRRLMPHYPIPVIMVSALTQRDSQTTLDALAAGAVDFVAKPAGQSPAELGIMLNELAMKIKTASKANLDKWKRRAAAVHSGAASLGQSQTQNSSQALPTVAAPDVNKLRPLATLANRGPMPKNPPARRICAIGASTGGTEALKEVFTRLPADFTGTVVVQHMPPKFTAMFAARMDAECHVRVKEAEDGDLVRNGIVYIAPGGDKQMTLRNSPEGWMICLRDGPKVQGHCPSVTALFESVAQHCGAKAVGAILTGMGGDGSDGMLKMRQAGARTLGQNEASCVVYGMPKVAMQLGAVERELQVEDIGPALVNLLKN
jgi:two-component system, chemotaxis family, protein-glutamate methylesterase/glutaminase